MALRFKHINSYEDFLKLKIDWNGLVKNKDVDHAFMKHEWFESWIRHLKPLGQLAIHTAWDKNRLVAIAPLQIVRQVRKNIPLKILSFLRSSVTPRSNFILNDNIDINSFFDSVFTIKKWDIAELKTMEHGITTTGKFIDYLKNSKRFIVEKGLQSPYDLIDMRWEDYYNNQSKNYKKNNRKYLNRLKNADSYEIIRIDSYNDFVKYFDRMIETSHRSWKAEGKTDLKSMPNMAEFYREFTKLGDKDKLFLIYVLIIENNIAGFSYHLKYSNRLVSIRWEYDEEFGYYMPGRALHDQCIMDICETKEKWEYDLSGMPTEHKVKLTSNLREHIDITVGRPGFFGNFILFFKKMMMKTDDISNEMV